MTTLDPLQFEIIRTTVGTLIAIALALLSLVALSG